MEKFVVEHGLDLIETNIKHSKYGIYYYSPLHAMEIKWHSMDESICTVLHAIKKWLTTVEHNMVEWIWINQRHRSECSGKSSIPE